MSEDTSRDIVISPMLAITSRSAVFLVMVILLLVGACYGFASQLQPLGKRVKELEARATVLETKVVAQRKSLQSILKALQELEPK
jgi:hypothetical protein